MTLEEKQLIAFEGFLRRTAEINAPFMLKGSLLTRQYFDNPNMRIAQDLDFVYLEVLDEVEVSKNVFSDWTTKVTETTLFDKLTFDSFQKNAFWRSIDYAMSEDFPTVNTDLICHLEGEEIDLDLDISFNLDIDFPPEPLIYRPLFGEPFLLKYTCPYALQVSWKLHQTIVRPRLKDIFDLILLLKHEKFNAEERLKILSALKKECDKDKIKVDLLFPYLEKPKYVTELTYEKYESMIVELSFWEKLSGKSPIEILTNKIEKTVQTPDLENLFYSISSYKYFTSKAYFKYNSIEEIIEDFRISLLNAGFTKEFILENI